MYLIVIERSTTGYAAFSPDVPGCVATGPNVENTLSEMKSALVFHFEGMRQGGGSLPVPKGLEYYVRRGEYTADPGDLLITIAADDLIAAFSGAIPLA